MFSAIFGRRKSPVEEEPAPIPGPRTEDGFVILNPSPPRGLYPHITHMDTPPRPYYPGVPAYPARPAPQAPVKSNSQDQGFHYLQGVPFMLAKELRLAMQKDTFAVEINDVLAYATRRVNVQKLDYSFDAEKAVLKECS